MTRHRVRVKRNRNASKRNSRTPKGSKRGSKTSSKRDSEASLKQSGGWLPYYNNYTYIDWSGLYAYNLVNSVVYTDDILFDNRYLLNDYYYDLYTMEAINEINYQYALWELANPSVTYTYTYEPYVYWLNEYSDYIVKIDEKNNNTTKPNPSVNRTKEVVAKLIDHIEHGKVDNNPNETIISNTQLLTKLINEYIKVHVEKTSFDKLNDIIEEMTSKLNIACKNTNNIENKCELYLSGFEQVRDKINGIMTDNKQHNDNTLNSITKFNTALNEIRKQRQSATSATLASTSGGKYY